MEQGTLRALHHWPCSGGTLISQCVAALPRVVFLNEIHPLAHLRLLRNEAENTYCPTDILRQLSYSHNNKDPALIIASFAGAITALVNKSQQQKMHVVIRPHDHIDFFCGPLPASEFILSRLFAGALRMLNALTVRHPLDSWLGLLNTPWYKQISLYSLDVFCERCLRMIEAAEDFPRLNYELFVLDPARELEKITKILELTMDLKALENFNQIPLSGASGRRSALIEPRPRRPVSKELALEAAQSSHYQQLCHQLSYQESPDGVFPYLT